MQPSGETIHLLHHRPPHHDPAALSTKRAAAHTHPPPLNVSAQTERARGPTTPAPPARRSRPSFAPAPNAYTEADAATGVLRVRDRTGAKTEAEAG
ncbi:unnamed protein product [Cutaneotrichosporon oleaginosum]